MVQMGMHKSRALLYLASNCSPPAGVKLLYLVSCGGHIQGQKVPDTLTAPP